MVKWSYKVVIPRLRLVDGDSVVISKFTSKCSSADDTYNITLDYGNTTASALKIEVDGTDIAIQIQAE